MPTRILVVDDEPHFERLILQRFRRKIREKELEFVFAQDGELALQRLSEDTNIDLILSDINMPKMDGLTFISKMIENGFDLKTVIVSAYGDMVNIRTAMNLGAYDFVTKPINFDDLDITIQKALREIDVIKQAQKDRQKLNHLEQELYIASEIQHSILPQNFSIFPDGTDLQLYAKMIPAKEVGGDFFDFFFIEDHLLAMVIGDVSGKGMPAALFMAVSRTLIKSIGLKSKGTGECLSQVNSLLSQDNSAFMFVTVFLAVLNLKTDTIEYTSGGHNPPYLLHADGQITTLNDAQHVALGIVEDAEYPSNTRQLKSGDALILFTDGIPEAVDEHENLYSDERFISYLPSLSKEDAKGIVNATIQEVKDYANDTPQSDDITMLVLKKGGH